MDTKVRDSYTQALQNAFVSAILINRDCGMIDPKIGRLAHDLSITCARTIVKLNSSAMPLVDSLRHSDRHVQLCTAALLLGHQTDMATETLGTLASMSDSIGLLAQAKLDEWREGTHRPMI
jgi:hypothetical protein